MLIQIVLPLLIHAAPVWLWLEQERQERVITATVAIKQAQRIQPLLQRSRRCLTELKGWSPDSTHGSGVLASQVRDTGIMLTLECDQDRKDFSVTVHWFADDHAYVGGPFDGPLTITYGHFSAPESKVVPPNPDIRALAELIAYGGS